MILKIFIPCQDWSAPTMPCTCSVHRLADPRATTLCRTLPVTHAAVCLAATAPIPQCYTGAPVFLLHIAPRNQMSTNTEDAGIGSGTSLFVVKDCHCDLVMP